MVLKCSVKDIFEVALINRFQPMQRNSSTTQEIHVV